MSRPIVLQTLASFTAHERHTVSLLETSADTLDGTGQSGPPVPPLSSIKAVASYLPNIEAARQRVISDMEQMVITGLRNLVCGLHLHLLSSLYH